MEVINDIIKEKYDEVKENVQEKVNDLKANTSQIKSEVEEK
ncbi:hypothetical protein PL321_15980 [Caloramator sp. mosi_1]|nr:hypothetical protein [Caloramator sp. mosi_1]WDC83910.1 hypothetical protein PL321_15980 [Caloramator sp. mosi_1]